jgi:hypothetical protein
LLTFSSSVAALLVLETGAAVGVLEHIFMQRMYT